MESKYYVRPKPPFYAVVLAIVCVVCIVGIAFAYPAKAYASLRKEIVADGYRCDSIHKLESAGMGRIRVTCKVGVFYKRYNVERIQGRYYILPAN